MRAPASDVQAVVFALLVLAVLADPAAARSLLGFEVGVNRSVATLSPAGGSTDTGYRTGWAAGLTCEVPIASRWSLATGLRYLQVGERVAIEFPSARFERRLTWHYVALPVMARVRLLRARGPYLAAGLEPGWLVGVSHQDRGENLATPSPAPSFAPRGAIFEDVGTFFGDPARLYRAGNLALASAIGWDVPVAGYAGRVEIRYAHGLVDIAKSDAFASRTRAFELLVGVR